MSGLVILDSNLALLLVVGTADRALVSRHKRLDKYSVDDFDLLELLVQGSGELVFLPHILAETSNLARQIGHPARARIERTFSALVETTYEYPLPSLIGVNREEFSELGLTDAVILHFCSMSIDGRRPKLITADTPLANRASALGYNVIDYRSEYLS